MKFELEITEAMPKPKIGWYFDIQFFQGDGEDSDVNITVYSKTKRYALELTYALMKYEGKYGYDSKDFESSKFFFGNDTYAWAELGLDISNMTYEDWKDFPIFLWPMDTPGGDVAAKLQGFDIFYIDENYEKRKVFVKPVEEVVK